MAGYNVIKTQRSLPIGSVQPWGGNLSNIPSGWLLCNNQELNANEYPLLARILRDTYGGQISGTFPNYSGTFRLPPLNDKACADISTGYFGVYAGANTTTWTAGATVYDGDLILSGGKYYTVVLIDTTALTGTLGTTAPTHTTGTVANSSSVNLKAQTVIPGAVPSPIDNPAALTQVFEFIGDSVGGFEPGDLGPPNVQNARTDINMKYVPDPEGTIVNISVTGTAPTLPAGTSVKIYTITSDKVSNGAGVQGSGAAFLVVVNDDNTYSVATKQKGQSYEINDVLTITGDKFSDISGVTPANDITITITKTGNSYFEGTITGQSLIKGFSIKEVYIMPRKMGRNHFPQHYHEGSYDTINFNDAGDRPGLGVTVFANPDFNFYDFYDKRNPCPPEQIILGVPINCPIPGVSFALNCSDSGVTMPGSQNGLITNMDTSPWTEGPGRFAIGIVGGGLPIKGYIPAGTAAAGHGIAKTWFNEGTVKNLRNGANQTSVGASANKDGSDAEKLASLKNDGRIYPGFTIPFSDSTQKVAVPNYFDGTNDPGAGAFGYTEVLFNHAAVDFLKDTNSNSFGSNDVIETHDHDSTFTIQYDGSALDVDEQITIKVQPKVIPDNIPDALQITFTTRVASLTVTNLIRAY